MQALLPKGVSVSLPDVAERYGEILLRVEDVFRKWGFRKVRTPIFEYYDEVCRLIDESLKGAVVKLVERETGRVIALRPDFTPQVARLAATILKDMPRPLRLFYHGSVFRWPHEGSFVRKQSTQVGLEIIGLGEPEACAELVAICKEALDLFEVKDYTVVISNISLLREILSPFPQDTRRKIAHALARKDLVELEGFLRGAPIEEKRLELIKRLPQLVGGEEVLEEIEEIFCTEKMKEQLDETHGVIEVLKSYGLYSNVLLDFSEIRGMVYHRGFFFEVFAREVGRRIAVGGRYDGLMERYGSSEPAMGFAFSLEELYRAIEINGVLPKAHPVDVLVVDMSRVKSKGMEIAKILRSNGFSVARDIIKRELKSSVDYAKIHGIKTVVVVDEKLKSLGKLKVIDVSSGMDKVIDEDELLTYLEA